MHPANFIIMVVATLLLAGQNYFHFLLRDETVSLSVAAVETALVVIFYIGIVCSVKAGSKEIVCLTFLIDKLFIAMCGG